MNSASIAPAFVSRSRNAQMVFASGTLSVSPSPRKRMNESRSLIRNSARSSERLFCAWMTRILNIITGSNGGRPPFAPSPYPSAVSSSGRNISKSTTAANASSWSPMSLSRLSRSSTSNSPGCLAIPASAHHAGQ